MIHATYYLQMLWEKIFSIKLNNNAIATPRCGGRNVPGAVGRWQLNISDGNSDPRPNMVPGFLCEEMQYLDI